MRRWVVVLALLVVSATARAQSTPAPAAGATASAPAVLTQRAADAVAAIEKRVAQLATQRQTLNARLADQQRAAAELKRQKPSWRRDRELRDQLAEEHETTTQLATVARDLDRAQAELAAARRNLVAAIDAELASGAAGPRAQQLAAWRNRLVPQVSSAPKRIVVPDTKIDPLADPEELDEQAAALREAEAQLQRQVTAYDTQSKDLERVAALHRQHDRAIEMDRRDDNGSRRATQQPTSRGVSSEADNGPAPTAGQSPPPPTDGGNTGSGPGSITGSPGGKDFSAGLDSDARTILGDVVDPSTLDALAREARSGDPAKRADAAKKLRDAVAAKLAQLRQGRQKVEQRAKQLRGGR